jgi:sec-independent protein translocase protein TatA
MNISSIAFLQNLSTPEIVMIGAVILLFFGAKRLPELVRSLGTSVKEFKQATSGIEEDIRTAMDVDVKETGMEKRKHAAESSKTA